MAEEIKESIQKMCTEINLLTERNSFATRDWDEPNALRNSPFLRSFNITGRLYLQISETKYQYILS